MSAVLESPAHVVHQVNLVPDHYLYHQNHIYRSLVSNKYQSDQPATIIPQIDFYEFDGVDISEVYPSIKPHILSYTL